MTLTQGRTQSRTPRRRRWSLSSPATLRVELELDISDRIPLRKPTFRPAVSDVIFAALNDINPERESADIRISVAPVEGKRVRAVRLREEKERARNKDRQRRGENSPMSAVASSLIGEFGGRGAGGAGRRMGQQRLSSGNTAVDPESDVTLTLPMFDCQILIRVTTPDRRRSNLLMDRLVGAFGAWSGGNKLVARPARSAPAFDALMDSNYLRRGKKRMWMPSDVLSGLFVPPDSMSMTSNAVRLSSAVPQPPPNVPIFDPDSPRASEMLPWGFDVQRQRYVGAWLAESLFSWTGGKSGYGKTETSICRFLHVVNNGHGAMFVDPNADAVNKIKLYLDPILDRVMEVSVATLDKASSQVGWNLFDVGDMDEEDRGMVAAAVRNAVSAAVGWEPDRATRALPMLTAACNAIVHLAHLAPREICPTIFQIPTLLTNEDWREALVPHLPYRDAGYWKDSFASMSAEAATPIVNLIYNLGDSRSVRALLGSSIKTYDFREVMDQGKILLFRLGGTGPTDKLLASLAVYDMMRAMMSRRDLPPADRRPFYVWMDEVQSFVEAVKANIVQGLEEGRKYGLRLHLMNQEPTRLPEEVLQSIFTNRSHLMCTAVGQQSATKLSAELGRVIDPASIVSIEKYHFVTTMTVKGATVGPFGLKGLGVEQMYGDPPGDLTDEERDEAIRVATGARPVDDTLADLDKLDDRLYDFLIGLPAPNDQAEYEAAISNAGVAAEAEEDIPGDFIKRPEWW